MKDVLRIPVPLRLPSLANCRMHWRALAKMKATQKAFVGASLFGHALPALPAEITLVRIGPRKLDSDNLAGAFKAVRDRIAEAYGVDDGSDLYHWRYEQRTQKWYGIEILFASLNNP